MRGYVSRPYVVGTKFMDADRYGIKRIKEVVKEDGTVVVLCLPPLIHVSRVSVQTVR